jgi:MFS transporter, DHA1 family, tetracycline resistance protein
MAEQAASDPATAAAGTRPAPGRAAFAFIFATVVLDMLALGLVIPVLPKLTLGFLGGDEEAASRVVGLFGFGWAGMQLLFQPLLGGLSDRFGRRPVLILSSLGLGLDYVLMALAPSLWWLFAGRLISGATAATFSTAGAYVADVTPGPERAARFGLLSAAFGIGFVLGPAVGGMAANVDLRLPFWLAAGLSLANTGYGIFVLPESLPRDRRSPFQWRRASPRGAVELLRSDRLLLGLGIAGFFNRVAHASLPSIYWLYAHHRYGWNEGMIGVALSAVGLSQMAVSGGVVRPVVARFGERAALLLGLGFGIAGFVLAALAQTGLLFVAAIPLLALWGLSSPSAQGLMTQQVGPSRQGELQGAQGSVNGIADLVGPLIFTLVFAWAIDPRSLVVFAGAPYLLAAALTAAALAVSWRTVRG